MAAEEIKIIIEFFSELEAPLPDELIKNGYKDEDFSCPIIYAINYYEQSSLTPKIFRFCDNIFNDKDKLRLSLLSIFKDAEGVGKASINSIRLYRVLNMYKLLKSKGYISKKDVDTLLYPDAISKSMYYRDISVIKEIEYGNLIFDKRINGYKLIE